MHKITKEHSDQISHLEKQFINLKIKEANIKDFKAKEISVKKNIKVSQMSFYHGLSKVQ